MERDTGSLAQRLRDYFQSLTRLGPRVSAGVGKVGAKIPNPFKSVGTRCRPFDEPCADHHQCCTGYCEEATHLCGCPSGQTYRDGRCSDTEAELVAR